MQQSSSSSESEVAQLIEEISLSLSLPALSEGSIVFPRFVAIPCHLYPADTHTLDLSYNLLPHFPTAPIPHCLQVFPLKF
jgi:hypothetical protein